MATRRDRSKELRELARTIRRLMLEHEMANTTRVKVSSALSRILKHDEGWRALRLRKKGQSDERVAKEPSFFTVVDAANELNVPICALVPTMEHQVVTEPQRKLMTLYARWSL